MDLWTDVKTIQSTDANVMKYVFTAADAVAEAVLYKYPTYADRTVICCSTQSGCPVGCRFCGAGDYFVRSLTADEIFDQPLQLLDDACNAEGIEVHEIQNLQIMFMSMGEPLLNLKNLIPAMHLLHEHFPQAKLLISTSGPRVPEPIWAELMWAVQEIPTIGLQFSVHESTDEARNKLIPFKKKWALEEIAEKGREFAQFASDGRRPFFNYCVHDVNNTPTDADRLAELFDPEQWEATLSVVCEREESIAAANERQRMLTADFMGLMLARDFSTRMFDPAGQDDIGGGCGQLWFVQDWMRKNPDKARPSIGNGLPVVHTPIPTAA